MKQTSDTEKRRGIWQDSKHKMGGRLTGKDMDQLEKWIGTGPKTFTLLYAITIDGCSSKIFHEKCDEKGPTVTVLYNTEGSVYGGYNPTTWQSTANGYSSSSDAFLFQLQYNGNPKETKFPQKKGTYNYAINNQATYGPTFGGGPDLYTFHDTVPRTDAYFALNGSTNFGHSYEMHGVSNKEINNGNLNVTELEVYKVTYAETKVGKAWRQVGDWDQQLLDNLKEEIITFKPVPDLNFSDAKIAMIGPVGAGKSSLYNTIESIFRGRITKRACSGSAEQSITTGYMPYTIRTGAGEILNFMLCDTPGLETSAGLEVHECDYLLDGNIPNFYQFNSKTPLSPKTEGFEADTTEEDIIRCVVFVLDATTLDVLSPEVIEKIKKFQGLMNKRGIPQLIVLTKIDKLCKDVQDDVSFTFKSWVVEEQVGKASQLLGLPRSNVMPVKNYEKETQLDINVNILMLLALRQILHSVEDFMLNILDRQRFANMKVDEK